MAVVPVKAFETGELDGCWLNYREELVLLMNLNPRWVCSGGVAAAVVMLTTKKQHCRMGMSWADEQLKWLWGDAGYVCKTAGGSCVIITGNPRKIARMNMEFRMDGLCKNGYAA
ncbi:hypothetical protein C5167_023290 [Papaver somniferum]|uniref:Uncharacterized protein n=1 Tax=Papaver somniferum TaxID=3469 RepID=A0A4Y7JNB5_PAPSO|nr:hypothetical protein C5167_023290 [Papaver somniferum]